MVNHPNRGTGLRVTPTVKEKYRVFSLLRENIQLIDGSEKVKYADGWSDTKVAEAVGGNVKASHVARFRREAIGDLQPHKVPKGAISSSTKARVLAIETAFNALCDSLGAPQFKV